MADDEHLGQQVLCPVCSTELTAPASRPRYPIIEFSSGILGAFFSNRSRWKLSLDNQFLTFHDRRRSSRVLYESIRAIEFAKGYFWTTIAIEAAGKKLRLGGIGNSQGVLLRKELKKRVIDALYYAVTHHKGEVARLNELLESLLESPRYISNQEIKSWMETCSESVGSSGDTILTALSHHLFPMERLDAETKKEIGNLMELARGDFSLIKRRDKEFVDRELKTYASFFDSVEERPLTEEQRRAAVIMEDRNLLIAAAGSGKTSAVVAKVGYALKSGYVTPEQVLIMAFNRDAVDELKVRINQRLGDLLNGQQVEVQTFHALGRKIIAEADGKKPSSPKHLDDDDIGWKLMFSKLIGELTSSDADFTKKWILFRALYIRPARDPREFKDPKEWNNYVKSTGDSDGGGYRTMAGQLVKSQGELAIANWLFMHGVNYEYERPYEYETATKEHRQYCPDFYFPEIDCYLEHYALDKNGNPPPAFKKYGDSMEWKRSLHKKKGTVCLETTYAEFVSDKLFQKLETLLTDRGVVLELRDQQELMQLINKQQQGIQGSFLDMIQSFMRHARANQVTPVELRDRAKKSTQPVRSILFVEIIIKVLNAYRDHLERDKKNKLIDFEDMITKSAARINEGKFNHPYKLVLVDEFQDISQGRAALLKAILNHSPECKLFAVGDDWQSIYRFSGSDISIFTGFEEHFGITATNYLSQTFRSNQGIADVAATFVQKNPKQFSKLVKAADKTTDQVIVVRKYRYPNEELDLITSCLDEIADLPKAPESIPSVFLLGRKNEYNHIQPSWIKNLKKSYKGRIHIESKTVHSSKGLQSDYVILIGLYSAGFPSLLSDDPLLQLVMPDPEVFLHAEERRLFYVALTRAKNRVYLVANKGRPSVFVDELEQMKEHAKKFRYPVAADRKPDPPCPIPTCNGVLLPRHGGFKPFLGCSEYSFTSCPGKAPLK